MFLLSVLIILGTLAIFHEYFFPRTWYTTKSNDPNALTLFGSPASYFTGKTRAYLRYKGIPFHESLTTIGAYLKVIIPKTSVHLIPIIMFQDGSTVQDTTDIMDQLEAKYPETSVYPSTPRQKMAALLLECYGDDWWVIPALHYRWSFLNENGNFIRSEFGRTMLPNWPRFVQNIIGRLPAKVFSSFLPVIGVTEKTVPALENRVEKEILPMLNEHFKHHQFFFGSKPSLGDFGMMGPFFAHLYRDPYPGVIMRKVAPRVCEWVERMNSPEPRSGAFLPNDDIPLGTVTLLKYCTEDMLLAYSGDQVKELGKYVEEHKVKVGDELPRRITFHMAKICGVAERRAVPAYQQWMLQRPYDYYRSLSGSDKAVVDSFLSEIGALEFFQTLDIKHRVKRVNNRLVLAS